MKKILIFVTMLALTFSCAFAQEATATTTTDPSTPDLSTRVIDIEDTYANLHPKAATVKIQLEYVPLTGEVRLSYTCMAASYDQGEAMNTAMAVLQDFQKQNQYYHYTYKEKDKTKYFKDGRDVKMVTYKSHVLFTR